MSPGARVAVSVEGRELSLSNLDKVLWPAAGFTKGAVIDFYSRLAPVLLPHLADRPLTLKRYPNGVDGGHFYEKNRPVSTPGWVRTATLPSPGSTKGRDEITYVVAEEVATLVWLANLADLELHTPQFRLADPFSPDRLVLDLDPGPPATVVECCAVALLLRELLVADGLDPAAKTSGSKGMQLVCGLAPPTTDGATSAYARSLAQRLGQAHPALVVSQMTKVLRPGKVLVDWSQNSTSKTTVAAYSLRAVATPRVSTPVTWTEVEDCLGSGDPADLAFLAADVLERVQRYGDLHAATLTDRRPLPS